MMIRFIFQYGGTSIELFQKYESYHLVREGHEREGEFAISPGIHFGGESVGTAYDEYQLFGQVHLLLQKGGKLHRGHGVTVFVQQYHGIGRAYFGQYGFPFFSFLLLKRQVFGLL